MPELPDLQVFSQNLTKLLKGKTVKKVDVIKDVKLNVSTKELKKALEDQKITSISRVGKELHFTFGNKTVLGLHLMLRGKLNTFEEKNTAKFPIIELLFTDNTGIAMSDFQGQATPTLNPEDKDAPDAMSDEVNYGFLKTKLNKSKAAVKNVLLDQHVIRGIGNAYADEILYVAGISPFSTSNNIPDAAIKKLDKAIKSVLTNAEKAILKSNPDIISGEVRDFLAIHNAKKKESPTGGKIIQSTAGGRKTYYTEEQEQY
ncbi:DNA-formamidopyrimidine glycosylase family protein [Pseudochryseolinea flava]|uniref:Fpg/Nei family DNA glycosylase n=1 Tax=Pseudochryseolinea flava TaxID=2059302 RepID=A0A364Y0V3_9BACT|nr:DNA-formamidopyrimidine glycosylase family protein [Pseudochryseolinea flava]RAW00319.1 Fpg/Nei family DNA glycosylase [Pseudochryseolinea flava]